MKRMPQHITHKRQRQCRQCGWQGKKYQISTSAYPLSQCTNSDGWWMELAMKEMADRDCSTIENLSICPQCQSALDCVTEDIPEEKSDLTLWEKIFSASPKEE